jgi:4-hydroxybenzoate polyprenyltransferase
LLYDAYSIWLFTQSDLKTIVIPQTTFGLFCALAMQPEVHLWVRVSGILARLPLMLLVVWINLLPFNIDNQRQPAAILEDKQNKPWRTMPAGRMTGKSAKKLMLRLYVVAFFVSIYVGGIRQCLALMVLGFCYNDLELADWSWSTRNAINGMGFCCFASAALEVALNEPLSMDRHDVIVKWLAMIAGIVFSTVQLQDMPDQQGDKLRGRKTMPLTMGDGTARWLTAMPMLAWSTVCPAYWGLGRGPSVALGGLGLAIALRSLFLRSVDADRTTFCLWNLWMACIYAMPLGAEAARAPVG